MDTCGNVTLCEEFRHVSHHNLVHYLQNVTFNDVDNFPFQFEEDTHDGPPRYSIISYVETDSGSHTNGNIFVENLNYFCDIYIISLLRISSNYFLVRL